MSFELFDSRGRDQRPTRPAGGPSVTVTDNRLLLVNRTVGGVDPDHPPSRISIRRREML